MDRSDDAVAVHHGDRGTDRRDDAGPAKHGHDRGRHDAGIRWIADDGMHCGDRPMGAARGATGQGRRLKKKLAFWQVLCQIVKDYLQVHHQKYVVVRETLSCAQIPDGGSS